MRWRHWARWMVSMLWIPSTRTTARRVRLVLLATSLLALTFLSPRMGGVLWAQLAPEPDAPPSETVPVSPESFHSPQSSVSSQSQTSSRPAATPRLASPPPSQSQSVGPQAAAARSEPGDGSSQSSASQPVATLRVTANLVDLFFVVHDDAGKPVPNLTRADCKVYEDKRLQTLKSFSAQSDLPLSLGILLDTSLSQQRVLPEEQKAASAFLRHILRPKDEAFLISFDVTVDLLADWTSSPSQLQQALDAAQINSSSGNYANGTIPSITQPKGTLLYDAVYLAANDKMRAQTGRKALILLTDGQDVGSQEKLHPAIEAAQKSDAIVYVLLMADPGLYGALDGSGSGAMRKLVEATGGEVFPIGKSGRKLPAAFNAVESQLRTEYLATYTPTNAVEDGSYRHIRVACRQNGKSLHVQARQGYYAVQH